MSDEMVKCPHCEGTGTDGHDRCYPPNDIICRVCDGDKTITGERYLGYQSCWTYIHNQENDIREANNEIRRLREEKMTDHDVVERVRIALSKARRGE